MATLKIIELDKKYQDTKVLNNINIDVREGEFIVIVGPSGCGKSSLLRMIAGLESITKGEIHLGKRLINDIEPKGRDIAMVFQNYALYPHMNVYQNISYGLKMRKFSKLEIEKRVQDVSKMLEINHLLTRKPSELSGGQRQRVAMGRAIVRKPSLFLFDEPLSNLDSKLRMSMRLEIKKMQRRLKITSLYVTHDQVEAMTMADRVLVLNHGNIEQFDTPEKIYNHPKTKFVAGFMSNTMNFLEPELIPKEVITLSKVEEKQSILGIKADDILIGGAHTIMLNVDLIETLGDEQLIHGTLDNKKAITLKCAISYKINEGESVPISFKKNKFHFFDKTTGENMKKGVSA